MNKRIRAVCVIEGCSKLNVSKGWCQYHWHHLYQKHTAVYKTRQKNRKPTDKTRTQKRLYARTPKARVRQNTLNMKARYGTDATHYRSLYEQHNGGCHICGNKIEDQLQEETYSIGERDKTKSAYIDHDHTTGLVRGLLCFRCNAGIGMMQDSPTVLRAAATYIESSRAAS